MMPLPANLRSYDQDKELYRVWGLVQHCNEVKTEDADGFQVGVAFVGKNPPESYAIDPATNYRDLRDDGRGPVEDHGSERFVSKVRSTCATGRRSIFTSRSSTVKKMRSAAKRPLPKTSAGAEQRS